MSVKRHLRDRPLCPHVHGRRAGLQQAAAWSRTSPRNPPVTSHNGDGTGPGRRDGEGDAAGIERPLPDAAPCAIAPAAAAIAMARVIVFRLRRDAEAGGAYRHREQRRRLGFGLDACAVQSIAPVLCGSDMGVLGASVGVLGLVPPAAGYSEYPMGCAPDKRVRARRRREELAEG